MPELALTTKALEEVAARLGRCPEAACSFPLTQPQRALSISRQHALLASLSVAPNHALPFTLEQQNMFARLQIAYAKAAGQPPSRTLYKLSPALMPTRKTAQHAQTISLAIVANSSTAVTTTLEPAMAPEEDQNTTSGAMAAREPASASQETAAPQVWEDGTVSLPSRPQPAGEAAVEAALQAAGDAVVAAPQLHARDARGVDEAAGGGSLAVADTSAEVRARQAEAELLAQLAMEAAAKQARAEAKARSRRLAREKARRLAGRGSEPESLTSDAVRVGHSPSRAPPSVEAANSGASPSAREAGAEAASSPASASDDASASEVDDEEAPAGGSHSLTASAESLIGPRGGSDASQRGRRPQVEGVLPAHFVLEAFEPNEWVQVLPRGKRSVTSAADPPTAKGTAELSSPDAAGERSTADAEPLGHSPEGGEPGISARGASAAHHQIAAQSDSDPRTVNTAHHVRDHNRIAARQDGAMRNNSGAEDDCSVTKAAAEHNDCATEEDAARRVGSAGSADTPPGLQRLSPEGLTAVCAAASNGCAVGHPVGAPLLSTQSGGSNSEPPPQAEESRALRAELLTIRADVAEMQKVHEEELKALRAALEAASRERDLAQDSLTRAETRVQSMRLRLYISESRLQMHEEALRRHVEAVGDPSASKGSAEGMLTS